MRRPPRATLDRSSAASDVYKRQVKGDRVEVVDLAKLQAHDIDVLARSATFGTDAVKAYARWMIWEIGQVLGARPASIHEFYICLLYTSPSPRDRTRSRMPSSA